jgi:disulfide bond formation protein DsbB
MCVYERLAVLTIFAAGLIGAIAPQFLLIRLIAFLTWATGSVWGLQLALQHTDYQMNPSPFATCEFLPNFPEWLPLHQLAPWAFNPTGDCANIEWLFLGYSMPQWLIATFSIYAIVFILVAIKAIFSKKSTNHGWAQL